MFFSGRIDRRTFIISQIVLVPLLYVAAGFFTRALTLLVGDYPPTGVPPLFRGMPLARSSATTVAWVAGLFGILLVLAALSFVVRRLHDLDFSGWFILLWPVLGYLISGFDSAADGSPIFESFLIMVPGIPGPNAYGPDPRPLAMAAAAAVFEPPARVDGSSSSG